MSFALPPLAHPARELMGDLATLAHTLDPANVAALLSTLQARRAAERTFEADTSRAVRRVAFVVLRADSDERWLITFGRRGGWRKEWNFGNGRPA
jgi:hypothetical protein